LSSQAEEGRAYTGGTMSTLSLARPVDPGALHFGPLGLGGAMPPEACDELLAGQMAELVLPSDVPGEVASQFEKLKALYRAGLFDYDSFTHAERDAYRVLEAALKARFVSHYAQVLPLTVNGARETRRVGSWDEVNALFRSGGPNRRRLTGHRSFNGSLAALLRWARQERYLYGQRNRTRERATLAIRNELAHTDRDLRMMPPEVYRTIRLVYETIRRLWGYDTPDGMIYPGPVARWPWILGLGPGEYAATWFPPDLLPTLPESERQRRTWYVVQAPEHEELHRWRPDAELTYSPVSWLWGPGTWDELTAEADRSATTWHHDHADVLDRTFYLRIVDGVVQEPRTELHVRALRDRRPDERWCIVKADQPGSALVHARGVRDGRCRKQGLCAVCHAESIESLIKPQTVDQFIRSRAPRLPGPRQPTDSQRGRTTSKLPPTLRQ
jgi:hypothetical protein